MMNHSIFTLHTLTPFEDKMIRKESEIIEKNASKWNSENKLTWP